MKPRKDQEITLRKDGSVKVAIINTHPSKTQQHFKDQCNASKIMEKYMRTGEIVHLNRKKGVYADLSKLGDYHESLEIVRRAKIAFDQLPAKIRKEFDNDPGKLVKFMSDKKNQQRAEELGLIEPKIHPHPDLIKKEESKSEEVKK